MLGVIADDFTGGTDVAGALARNGWRVVLTIGVGADSVEADAVVVALKSRTTPPDEAVRDSLAALRWLQAQGCDRFYFKYCSTFDSTPRGNIGPVTDALLHALGERFTVACPAFPDNGRTVYQGHLFVGAALLSESSMRHHPLTPMTDSNLVRVLSAQTNRTVGVWALPQLGGPPPRDADILVTDAVTNQDLARVAEFTGDLKLLTGGSGLAAHLPPPVRAAPAPFEAPVGHRAILAGSCSAATLGQLRHAEQVYPVRRLDPLDLPATGDVLAWAAPRLARGPVIVAASAEPSRVRAAQEALGVEAAGTLVEDALARIAVGLRDLGVRRLCVAGGETSGAVVRALGASTLHIGPEIAPGVPWTLSNTEPRMALALKSGNFGAEDFFTRLWDVL